MLVEVEISGVCGTDAHRVFSGDIKAPEQPVAFGHEAVGTIVALNGVPHDSAGHTLNVGDRVHWNPSGRCGACRACRNGGFNERCSFANWPARADAPNAAGFQRLATLEPKHPVYRLPDDTPSDAVVALGCALPTAIGAFERLGSVSEDDVVLVQGCGPVGLAVVILLAIKGVREIIVVDDNATRLEAAAQRGATLTLGRAVTSRAERRAALLAHSEGRGADIVVEATGSLSAFEEGIDLLAVGGRYVIVGLYAGSGTVALDPFKLNNANQSIIGSFGARADARRDALEIVGRHHERFSLAELVTHRFSLPALTDAIRSTATGEATKAVVQPRM